MADLAHLLLRTVARAFYTAEHALVIDALITHGTLQDTDLAHVLGQQIKPLRKLCGRLKEDGMVSVQTRAERKTEGSQSYYPGGHGQPGKERTTSRDWYYINLHRAIDSIKYHMYKLNKHVEKQGAPTTEKKEQSCPRCKAEWTDLEVMDYMDFETGAFLCPRCKHPLDPVEEEERANENESMKRLNSQLEKILTLMQQIDAATVPENDFQTALSKHVPVHRSDRDPGQQRTEIVDLPGKGMASSKGLEMKPEKLAVQVQDDETVKRESEAAEAQARKDKEARQNALPDWIAKSTVSGDITAVGAKEERLRKEREAHSGGATVDDGEEKKVNAGDADVMAAYWEELAKARAEEAAREKSDEEEDDDDEDDFEDVDVGSGTPMPNGSATANGTGANTPALESSNATDDERPPAAKKVRVEEPPSEGAAGSSNGVKVAEDTPAASDEDEDELEFENV